MPAARRKQADWKKKYCQLTMARALSFVSAIGRVASCTALSLHRRFNVRVNAGLPAASRQVRPACKFLSDYTARCPADVAYRLSIAYRFNVATPFRRCVLLSIRLGTVPCQRLYLWHDEHGARFLIHCEVGRLLLMR